MVVPGVGCCHLLGSHRLSSYVAVGVCGRSGGMTQEVRALSSCPVPLPLQITNSRDLLETHLGLYGLKVHYIDKEK